jgi:hypothetical protein
MIGHETEGQQADRVEFHRLMHYLNKGSVVFVLLKQGQTRHGTV